jgi:hypothetical protein
VGYGFSLAQMLPERRYFFFWRAVVVALFHPLPPSPSGYPNGETVRFQLEPWTCRVRNVGVQSAPWRILGQGVGLTWLECTLGHVRPENDSELSPGVPWELNSEGLALKSSSSPVSERTSPKALDQSESSAGSLSRTELDNAGQGKGRNHMSLPLPCRTGESDTHSSEQQ